jgi:hypothetical protein
MLLTECNPEQASQARELLESSDYPYAAATFEKMFPKAARVFWKSGESKGMAKRSAGKKYQVVSFEYRLQNMEAWYLENGNWERTISYVNFGDLSPRIQDSFAASPYVVYNINDCSMVNTRNADMYVITVKEGGRLVNLQYTEDGHLVGTH